MLTTPPSFMLSPTIPLLFVASHTFAHLTPSYLIPNISLLTELPLAILDAATRSIVVCDDAPPLVKHNPHQPEQDSPLPLLVTSTVRFLHFRIPIPLSIT